MAPRGLPQQRLCLRHRLHSSLVGNGRETWRAVVLQAQQGGRPPHTKVKAAFRSETAVTHSLQTQPSLLDHPPAALNHQTINKPEPACPPPVSLTAAPAKRTVQRRSSTAKGAGPAPARPSTLNHRSGSRFHSPPPAQEEQSNPHHDYHAASIKRITNTAAHLLLLISLAPRPPARSKKYKSKKGSAAGRCQRRLPTRSTTAAPLRALTGTRNGTTLAISETKSLARSNSCHLSSRHALININSLSRRGHPADANRR